MLQSSKFYLKHENLDKEGDYLVMTSRREFSMVVSSLPGSDTNKNMNGVVQRHASKFSNATSLNAGGQQKELCSKEILGIKKNSLKNGQITMKTGTMRMKAKNKK